MRRIIPKHVEEKKVRRNQFIAGGVLIGLMLLSTMGYAFQMIFNNSNTNAQNTIKYGGFNFLQQNNFWVLSTNIGNFIFTYNPNDVKKAPGVIDRINKYNKTKLYLYSDVPEGESEIRINLGQFASSIENACLQGQKCDQNTSIKNCDENFIVIREGKERVIQDKNCVFIEGNKADLVNLADEFLLKTLGIDS